MTYPVTAAQMTAACANKGTWLSGYVCNEASGNLAASFGSPSLVANGSPSYHNAGPLGSGDYAVGFTGNTDYFDGGTGFNPASTEDFIFAWIGNYPTAPADNTFLLFSGAFSDGRIDIYSMASGELVGEIYASSTLQATFSLTLPHFAAWHTGMLVIDRAAATIRMGVCYLATGQTALSAATSMPAVSLVSASDFKLGPSSLSAATTAILAALYLAKGVGAAAGLTTTANLSAALVGFAETIYPVCPVGVRAGATAGIVGGLS